MPFLMQLPWPPPVTGMMTLNNGLRNGVIPPGDKLRAALVALANRVGVQRQKILFQKSIRYTEAYDTATAADTWRFQFHTSPNCATVRVVMVVGHGNFDAAVVVRDPKVVWTTTIVGGASTAQDAIYHSESDGTTSVVVPDGMRVITQDWLVTADTKYRAQMNQTDQLRVLSASVHEIPRTVVISNETNIIDPSPYAERSQIYDSDAAEFQSLVTKFWKTMGTHQFAFCVDSTTGQTVTGTTWENLIDGATGGIGVATKGFQTWPNYHGSLDGVTATTEDIPVTIYAYMQTDNAANQAEVRFVDKDGVIGTLTSTSTTGEWVTSDVVWTATTAATSVKVDVEHRNVGVTDTTTVMAAGMYEYLA